ALLSALGDWVCSFFFQAEDGIRGATVTGVQTCALPICTGVQSIGRIDPAPHDHRPAGPDSGMRVARPGHNADQVERRPGVGGRRSEERRVGKEGTSRGAACPYKEKRIKGEKGKGAV